jgi:hypothetical protein
MLRVVDAHRLLGPLPTDDVESADAAGLVRELDRIGIAEAYATHTLSLYADPVLGNDALLAAAAGEPRLHPVPVVIPGVPGACVPERPAELPAWRAGGVQIVRFCPVRHRFDLGGPVAAQWLAAIADAGLAAAIELDETSPAALRALAAAHPRLAVLLLAPGYRRLRELAELLAAAPRIWVESGTLIAQRGVEWLAGQCGADRLVFGTGAPVLDDCGPRFQLDHLDLPDAGVARIAAGSLGNLLAAADAPQTPESRRSTVDESTDG